MYTTNEKIWRLLNHHIIRACNANKHIETVFIGYNFTPTFRIHCANALHTAARHTTVLLIQSKFKQENATDVLVFRYLMAKSNFIQHIQLDLLRALVSDHLHKSWGYRQNLGEIGTLSVRFVPHYCPQNIGNGHLDSCAKRRAVIIDQHHIVRVEPGLIRI